MTRARFRAAAAALVGLLLAGLGWVFLSPGETPGPEEGPGTVARKPALESGEEAEARAAVARSEAPTSGPVPAAPPDEVRGTGPVIEDREGWIPGVCVLEDGTPLAGVSFSFPDAARRDSPSPRDGADDEARVVEENEIESGVGGDFVLPSDRTVVVRHNWAKAISAEGGVLEQAQRGSVLRVAAGASVLRVQFRDDPGIAHVRLVDTVSLAPLLNVKGLRVTYLFGRDLSGRAVYDFGYDTGFGGWIPVRERALPKELGVEADAAGVVVEFAASGYAPKRVPLPDIRGRMEVGVDAVAPCVTGELRVPITLAARPPLALPITASIRPLDGQPEVDLSVVRGLPTEPGPFRLDDLPQGAWVLEISGTVDSAVRRARRTLEYRGTTVDLGFIDFTIGATVRARAVDAAGEPMPQARVVVVREGEDPGKARVLAPGEDGWVGCADLEPNASHRAVALGLPRPLESSVRTSADGKHVEVELSWPEKLVPCRLTLLVDGKAVANPDGRRTIPATVHESPLPREQGAWHADGTFEAKLVPGTYRFSVYATPEGGGDLALFAGEVTVPSGDAFEARVELRREGR